MSAGSIWATPGAGPLFEGVPGQDRELHALPLAVLGLAVDPCPGAEPALGEPPFRFHYLFDHGMVLGQAQGAALLAAAQALGQSELHGRRGGEHDQRRCLCRSGLASALRGRTRQGSTPPAPPPWSPGSPARSRPCRRRSRHRPGPRAARAGSAGPARAPPPLWPAAAMARQTGQQRGEPTPQLGRRAPAGHAPPPPWTRPAPSTPQAPPRPTRPPQPRQGRGTSPPTRSAAAGMRPDAATSARCGRSPSSSPTASWSSTRWPGGPG